MKTIILQTKCGCTRTLGELENLPHEILVPLMSILDLISKDSDALMQERIPTRKFLLLRTDEQNAYYSEL